MRLIIIDGLDGVGKDTHAEHVSKHYEDKGERVVVRSHPTSDNFFGRRAKKALLGEGKLNQIKASLYYMFDVLRSVRKYYGRKDIDTLIMVRYLMGTAYLPSRLARFGYNFFANFVPTSEIMIFLDASPEIVVERFKLRDEKEMFETLESLVKIRKKALMLADGWSIVDTSGSIKNTKNQIDKILAIVDKSDQ